MKRPEWIDHEWECVALVIPLVALVMAAIVALVVLLIKLQWLVTGWLTSH